MENIFLFKVRDFTTVMLGRYDPDNDCYYVERGDGTRYEYKYYRITWMQELACSVVRTVNNGKPRHRNLHDLHAKQTEFKY